MSFKFSLVSDLHLDFPHHSGIHPSDLEEWVIVAGDCSNGLQGIKTLKKLEARGHRIFAVPGNHESYANDSQGRTIKETEQRFQELIGHDSITSVRDNLHIVGVNGWYLVADEPLWLNTMNDGRYCGNAFDVNERAFTHANLVRNALQSLEGEVIVVTHTAPTLVTLDPRFSGHYSNDYYFNPYMGEILREFSDKIAVWCHGHTHAPADKDIFGVRVVCNPRGYPGENPRWKPVTINLTGNDE